jgi:hypothetical protein
LGARVGRATFTPTATSALYALGPAIDVTLYPAVVERQDP